MSHELLSVVVVDYYSGPALRTCATGVLNRSDVATELIVVDNSGQRRSAEALGDLAPRVRLVQSPRNVGFAAGANRGLALATGSWIALVNPDAEVPRDAFGSLVGYLQAHPTYAAVGPLLRDTEGLAQSYSFGGEPTPTYLASRALTRLVGRHPHDWAARSPRDVDWVSGACLVARREALERVGQLDERFFLYFEDVDWCRRCRETGWRIGLAAPVWVRHASTASYHDLPRRRYYRDSLRKYYAKYYGPGAALALALLQSILQW
jgi:GT2 family glycosyltransferase